jgi:hypothetical protein
MTIHPNLIALLGLASAIDVRVIGFAQSRAAEDRQVRNHSSRSLLRLARFIGGPTAKDRMNTEDPLAQFGLDAIDLRWTLKDVDSKRKGLINKGHLPKLVDLGLVEIREGVPELTPAGEKAAWK